MLESVLAAIDENKEIDNEIKEEIKSLIIVFAKFFPNISLENFIHRIKTLKMEKTNKLVSRRIYDYKPLTNVLSFSIEKLKQEFDTKHVMMCALLNIITAHDDTYGFDHDNKLVAFNTGYTEILANFLVGNETDLPLFEEEMIATNIMAEVIGNDTFFEAYFTNNAELVFKAMVEESVAEKYV